MQNLSTRIAMLVIAFGFFISCNRAYETIYSSAASQSSDELLAEAEQRRLSNPSDPVAYHLEGIAYQRMAREKAPDQREQDYTNMRNAMSQALSLYRGSSSANSERISIQSTLENSWSYEHNSAAGLVSSDQGNNHQRLSMAASHAHNAIVIVPDSLISYELLADIYSRMGNIDQAIQVLRFADSTLVTQSPKLTESLGFLYYTKGEYDDAISYYERALLSKRQSNPAIRPTESDLSRGSTLNTWHGLINTYIAARQTDNAIASIDELLRIYPTNQTYQRLLANQLINQIAREFESDTQPARATIVNNLEKISDLAGSDPEFILSNALNITEIVSVITDTKYSENESYDVTSDLDVMLLCDGALGMYQQVLDVDPSNPSAISGIADTYLIMGNEDEAARWYERME